MRDPLERLTSELERLPGVGPKTALRLAHHLLKVPSEQAERLANAILEVRQRFRPCSICGAFAATDPCGICSDPSRDRSRLLVVEESFNIAPFERTGEYRGLYHVLGGTLSPARGIGPERLGIERLLPRLVGLEELILATNPDVEGEATALYLARRLRSSVPRITRLAFGMPIGGSIEFTDQATLARSLTGRREVGS